MSKAIKILLILIIPVCYFIVLTDNVFSLNPQFESICDGQCSGDDDYAGCMGDCIATYESSTGGPANEGGGGGGGSAVTLPNPLGAGNEDPRVIIGNVIKAVLGIVGSLALGVFIFGGLTWVTSAGSEEKITKGKNMIIWATLGLVVIFMSYAMVTLVIDAVTGGSDTSVPGTPDTTVPGTPPATP